jgi:hypothetical protein
MKFVEVAACACAVMALGAVSPDADAKGGRGGRAGAHHSHHSHHHHGGHAFAYRGSFVASTFVVWPRADYWPDYAPAAAPVVEYWYYCQPYAAYYPYVQECPTEWQPVLPSAPSPES